MSLAVRINAPSEFLERSGNSWDYNAAYTIHMWVMLFDIDTTAGGWFFNLLNSGGTGFDVLFTATAVGDEGKLRCRAQESSGVQTAVTGTTVLSEGVWYYLRIVRESNSVLKVYLNGSGTPEITVNQSVASRTVMSVVDFGAALESRRAFHRVHAAALSQAEGLAERYSTTAVRTANLVADWPLQSDTAGVFPDISGAGLDLTFTGTASYELGPFQPIGQATETDSAFSLSPAHRAALGQAAEIDTALGFILSEQSAFQFRDDDGSEATATALAALNTNISRGPNVPARLRLQVDYRGDPASEALKLQYRKVGDLTWLDLGP